MAMLKTLFANGVITGTTTGAAVSTNDSPFVEGRNAIVRCTPLGGTPTILIETALDAAFTLGVVTALTLNAANASSGGAFEIALQKFIRYRQTVAGTGSAFIQVEGVQ